MTGLPVFTPRGVSASDVINQRLDQLEKSRRPASPPRATYKPALATTSENFPGGDGFVDDIHRRLDMLGSCGSSNAAPKAAPKALKKAEATCLKKAEATAPKAAAPSSGLKFKPHEVSQASMDNYLKNLFEIGDTNGDGVLQPAELAKLLKLTGFNLESGAILDIVQAADVDGDGLIQYDEFVPIVRDMLANPPAAKKGPEGANPNLDFQKLKANELEAYLTQLFKIADANGDGVLQPTEYVQLMRLSGLKFSDDMILQGLTEADTNQDGVIDYAELVAYFKKHCC
jgi:calmodulin